MLKVSALVVLLTGLIWGTSRLVARHCGAEIGARLLEADPTYTAQSLIAWVRSDPTQAARYALPILVPLDLLFMTFVAASMAIVSVLLAAWVPGAAGLSWMVVLVPALFLATDLSEDVLLVRFLLMPDTISAASVRVTYAVTTLKMWLLYLAAGQVAILALAGVVSRVAPR